MTTSIEKKKKKSRRPKRCGDPVGNRCSMTGSIGRRSANYPPPGFCSEGSLLVDNEDRMNKIDKDVDQISLSGVILSIKSILSK